MTGKTTRRRWSRFRLRALFVLITLVALGLAIPRQITAWKARQVEPIRQALVQYHYQGDLAVIRRAESQFLLRDVFGDERSLTIFSIDPISFSGAQAQGSWNICEGRGLTSQGMHYELVRDNGQWKVKEATEISIGCGKAAAYAPEVWSRIPTLVGLLNSQSDPVIRRKACGTLAGLAWDARTLPQTPAQLPQVLNALAAVQDDPDPTVRQTASRGLDAAPK